MEEAIHMPFTHTLTSLIPIAGLSKFHWQNDRLKLLNLQIISSAFINYRVPRAFAFGPNVNQYSKTKNLSFWSNTSSSCHLPNMCGVLTCCRNRRMAGPMWHYALHEWPHPWTFSQRYVDHVMFCSNPKNLWGHGTVPAFGRSSLYISIYTQRTRHL